MRKTRIVDLNGTPICRRHGSCVFCTVVNNTGSPELVRPPVTLGRRADVDRRGAFRQAAQLAAVGRSPYDHCWRKRTKPVMPVMIVKILTFIERSGRSNWSNNMSWLDARYLSRSDCRRRDTALCRELDGSPQISITCYCVKPCLQKSPFVAYTGQRHGSGAYQGAHERCAGRRAMLISSSRPTSAKTCMHARENAACLGFVLNAAEEHGRRRHAKAKYYQLGASRDVRCRKRHRSYMGVVVECAAAGVVASWRNS